MHLAYLLLLDCLHDAPSFNQPKEPTVIKTLLFTMTLLAAPIGFAQQAAPTANKEPSFKTHILSRPELDALLKHPENILLIDVRRPDELTAIGGFPVYLSIQINDLESRLSWIPKDRQIVTVSNHAARAGKAGDLLTAKGYRVAGAVGVQLYEKDGGVLTKIAPPPPKASTSTAPANSPKGT
jgi:rhodanese-related sulfurtransferase